MLTPEAFKAAGCPKRFPEQIKEGLLPWQPKKLYVGTGGGDGDTVQLDTGTEDPALGMSYWQFAVEGLRHQLSQGAGDGVRALGSTLMDTNSSRPRLGYRRVMRRNRTSSTALIRA